MTTAASRIESNTTIDSVGIDLQHATPLPVIFRTGETYEPNENKPFEFDDSNLADLAEFSQGTLPIEGLNKDSKKLET